MRTPEHSEIVRDGKELTIIKQLQSEIGGFDKSFLNKKLKLVNELLLDNRFSDVYSIGLADIKSVQIPEEYFTYLHAFEVSKDQEIHKLVQRGAQFNVHEYPFKKPESFKPILEGFTALNLVKNHLKTYDECEWVYNNIQIGYFDAVNNYLVSVMVSEKTKEEISNEYQNWVQKIELRDYSGESAQTSR